MARYEWQQITHDPGYENPFEIDGEIVPGTVQSGDPRSTRFSALVRLPEPTTTFVNTSEGVGVGEVDGETAVAVEPSGQSEDPQPQCGVNGCSRNVDLPEDTCWQHEE